MTYRTFVRRAAAYVLAYSMVFAMPTPVGALDSIFGTIRASGAAYVASDANDWSRLSTTRPLISGDRLKTGSDGYVLADLGADGVVGLFSDAYVTTTQMSGGPVIDVHGGRVAFHLSPESNLKLQAKGAGIMSQTASADGYVEYGPDGVPVVTVEEGNLLVYVNGVERELTQGESLVLQTDAEMEPVQLAAQHGKDEDDDDKKAGAAMVTSGEATSGVSTTTWTAIGLVAVAAGGAGTAVAISGGSGGDGPGS